jgi:hypothetical protein
MRASSCHSYHCRQRRSLRWTGIVYVRCLADTVRDSNCLPHVLHTMPAVKIYTTENPLRRRPSKTTRRSRRSLDCWKSSIDTVRVNSQAVSRSVLLSWAPSPRCWVTIIERLQVQQTTKNRNYSRSYWKPRNISRMPRQSSSVY